MKLNYIEKEDNKRWVPSQYQENIPEWARYFEAIASNGDLNRNGYIIRPQAWEWSIKNFLENGVILYQHDTEKPIGKPLDAKVTDKGELWVAWYINDTNNYSEWNIFNGNVTGISTGHITEAVEFENEETGEVLSEEEFLKEHDYIDMGWFGTYITPGWVLAVTKADWLEFSFVTLASNKKSKVKYINAIENYLKNKGIECKIWDEEWFMKNLLKEWLDNLKLMLNKPELSDKAKEVIQAKINEVEEKMNEEETPSEETPAEPVVETPTEEVKEEAPAEETPTEEVTTEEKPAEEWVETNSVEEEQKPEWCTWDCEDCPADCEDNETPKQEEEKAEEIPSEEVASEETPTEETPSEEVPSEETPSEETPTETAPEAPETSGWDTTTPTGGEAQAENNSVEINAKLNEALAKLEELNNFLTEANAAVENVKAENALLKTENEDLKKQVNEANELLSKWQETVEKLTTLVERAKNFSKQQGLNFSWEIKKSQLEQRAKFVI